MSTLSDVSGRLIPTTSTFVTLMERARAGRLLLSLPPWLTSAPIELARSSYAELRALLFAAGLLHLRPEKAKKRRRKAAKPKRTRRRMDRLAGESEEEETDYEDDEEDEEDEETDDGPRPRREPHDEEHLRFEVRRFDLVNRSERLEPANMECDHVKSYYICDGCGLPDVVECACRDSFGFRMPHHWGCLACARRGKSSYVQVVSALRAIVPAAVEELMANFAHLDEEEQRFNLLAEVVGLERNVENRLLLREVGKFKCGDEEEQEEMDTKADAVRNHFLIWVWAGEPDCADTDHHLPDGARSAEFIPRGMNCISLRGY